MENVNDSPGSNGRRRAVSLYILNNVFKTDLVMGYDVQMTDK